MRLFAEGNLHGSLQASYSEEWMPCCIGSHYVVRTTHLKAAGGVGPELDEDMSTSYLINAAGFKVTPRHCVCACGLRWRVANMH
jgi:cellulose synthase (UDP-forming)